MPRVRAVRRLRLVVRPLPAAERILPPEETLLIPEEAQVERAQAPRRVAHQLQAVLSRPLLTAVARVVLSKETDAVTALALM